MTDTDRLAALLSEVIALDCLPFEATHGPGCLLARIQDALPAAEWPCIRCGTSLVVCGPDRCCDDCDHPYPRPTPDTALDAERERIRAGVLALGNVTGIVKASGNWDAFVVRSAVLALLGPEP